MPNSRNVRAICTCIFADPLSILPADVHRFDANAIPFDGPTGIVMRVTRLLDDAHTVDEEYKRELLDRFVRIILQNA